MLKDTGCAKRLVVDEVIMFNPVVASTFKLISVSLLNDSTEIMTGSMISSTDSLMISSAEHFNFVIDVNTGQLSMDDSNSVVDWIGCNNTRSVVSPIYLHPPYTSSPLVITLGTTDAYTTAVQISSISLSVQSSPTGVPTSTPTRFVYDPKRFYPTAFPTPGNNALFSYILMTYHCNAGGLLGVDWFLDTQFFMELVWPDLIPYKDNDIAKLGEDGVNEALAGILSPSLFSKIEAVQGAMYSKYLDGPEGAIKQQLQYHKYTVILSMHVFIGNYSTWDAVTANILNSHLASIVLSKLKSTDFPDLLKVTTIGLSTQASFSLPPPREKEENDLAKWVVISIVVAIALVIIVMLMRRKTVFRAFVLSTIERIRQCCTASATAAALASDRTKRIFNRRLHRFHRAPVDDDNDEIGLFNSDGLEMEGSPPPYAKI
jgi:hypothetical protein